MKLRLTSPFFSAYETPEEKAAADAAAAAAANNNKDQQQVDAEGNPIFKDGRLTQEQFNAEAGKIRKKAREAAEKTIQELEQIKKAKGLTEEEKTRLQTKIDELQQQVLTKEQLLANEKKRIENETKTAIEKETKEKELWKSRFERATIERSILDAAALNDGFNPNQFVHQFVIDARLVEEGDKFIPRIKFRDTDKDGNPVTLDLTPVEVVKRMKELPELYGNFFKSNLNGGLGGKQPAGVGKPPDFTKMSTAEYAEWRKKNPDLDVSKNR